MPDPDPMQPQGLPITHEVVRLHVEEVEVTKNVVDTAVVRVAIQTREHDHHVEETLLRESVVVDRVSIGRNIDAHPPIREEGDVTIISVVEEIVVIRRQLILKEEIHIRRVVTTESHTETVMLREQIAVVSRDERQA